MHNQHVFLLGETQAADRNKKRVSLPPPEIEPARDVFAEALLEEPSSHQRRSLLDLVVSIAIHSAILSALLILPLYYTAGLDFQKVNLTFLATPVMPAATLPPAPMISSAAARPTRITSARVSTLRKLTAPTFIPKVVVTTPVSGGVPPEEALMGVPGGVPGGIPGGQLGGVLGGALSGVPAPPVAEGPKVPVRVGGNVKPPRLLFGPEPLYPILAKQSHLSGVVIIEAVIDEHGNVKGMRVISGHPFLVPSALSAVSKRRYEPTVLDGEPTPIDLRVEISFSFS
jgi:protein TonB